MRLVIEREGGFDIVPASEAVTRIEVTSDAVEVWYLDSDGEESVKRVQMSSHAEACRVSAAIAVKCGVLVEPLAVGPEVVTESVMSDPNEVLAPPRNPRWDGGKRSEWVEGEPPRDGRWYVVKRSGEDAPRVVQHRNYINSVEAFYDADGVSWRGLKSGAHLPTPIPDR